MNNIGLKGFGIDNSIFDENATGNVDKLAERDKQKRLTL